jgi:hypothetical protein
VNLAGRYVWHNAVLPSAVVPPREIRNLGDLTRYRVKLVEEHNRIRNGIHKVLEDLRQVRHSGEGHSGGEWPPDNPGDPRRL